MAQHLSWYTQNSNRNYPVADNATGVSDSGDKLPDGIISDLRIRFPSTYGKYGWISAVHVTDNLVSIVFSAARWVTSDVDTSGGQLAFTNPVAFISVPKPIATDVVYSLDGYDDNISGWITFGREANDLNYRGIFTDPDQSFLLPRCCRAYEIPLVSSLRKLNRVEGLEGIVNFVADGDLIIEEDTITIEGEARRAIVFRLNDADSDGLVFEKYAGICGDRPESLNCDIPAVETINQKSPDCDGNINITFEGTCFTSYPYENDIGGIAIDICESAADVCPPVIEPDECGRMPAITIDGCYDQDPCGSWSSSFPDPEEPPEEEPPPEEVSSIGACEALGFPYLADFTGGSGADDFITTNGVFNLGGGNYVSSRQHKTNIAILDACDYANEYAVPVTIDTIFNISSQTSSNIGAGVVLNYHENSSNGRTNYVFVTLNIVSGQLEVYRFNGNYLVGPIADARCPAKYGRPYAIRTVVTQPTGDTIQEGHANNSARIRVEVYDALTEAEKLTFVTPLNDVFGPYRGRYGIGAMKCRAEFDQFYIRDSVYAGPIF